VSLKKLEKFPAAMNSNQFISLRSRMWKNGKQRNTWNLAKNCVFIDEAADSNEVYHYGQKSGETLTH
jgi:hypothetical protein